MTKWKNYEEVAAYLLHSIRGELNLIGIEGKQKIKGLETGTEWEIDAKGISENGEGMVIIECRRYSKSRQCQEKAAALAYRIKDTGAESAIFVSPLGLQAGAEKVAAANNIISVQISADSTPHDFYMKFLNRQHFGVTASGGISLSGEADTKLTRICVSCGKKFKVLNNEKICGECS